MVASLLLVVAGISLWSAALAGAEVWEEGGGDSLVIDVVTLQVGQLNLDEYSVAQESQVNFILRFNRTAQGQIPAVRVAVSSANASTLHPLLITARQIQGIGSWTLPYVENGFTFSLVERTLCPRLNLDPDNPGAELQVSVEVSTSSPTPIHFHVDSSFVEPFYHRLDTEVAITASPSSPAYLLFQQQLPEHSRVRVRFSSQDDTAHICAIASIQTTYCPNVELLDNPDHRGIFQTMRSQAAINVKSESSSDQKNLFDFYIVVSVFPSNGSCMSTSVATPTRLFSPESVDNFNPQPHNGGMDLTKNFNITIEPGLSAQGYVISVVVPIAVYIAFYFIAVGWILFSDWFRHWVHPLEKLIEDRKLKFGVMPSPAMSAQQELEAGLRAESDTSIDPEKGLTSATSQIARQLSELDQPELSLTHNPLNVITLEGSYSDEGGASGIEGGASSQQAASSPTHQAASSPTHQAASSPTHQAASSPTHRTSSSPTHQERTASSPTHLLSTGRMETDFGPKKSPSIMKRWHSFKDRVSDPAHRPAHRGSGDLTKKPSMLSVLFGSQYNNSISQVTTPSPHYPQYLHTPPPGSPGLPHTPTLAPARSVNESISYTRSTSLGNQNESARPRPQYNTSLSLTSPVVHQVSSFGYAGGSPRTAGENPPVGVDSPDYSEPRGDGLRLRPPHSYRQAVGGGKIVEDDREEGEELQVAERGVVSEVEEEEHDKYHTRNPFSVNTCMTLCELPEFDETERVQKQYNLLSWYLIAVIIFYAIPAYQLVITYQQLLVLSGNNDLCYYNSLCSHPWHIAGSFSLSTFNNIFSNIGYFMLGPLFIIIAYRRRRVYRAVEQVVNSPFFTNKEERVGVPQHFGIYYAVGVAQMAVGLMSVAYHICPGKANYQFDTTFMFVLAGLGIFKVLESRSPDLHPGFHKLLVLLAGMIVMVVVGVVASVLVFYLLFSLLHVVVTLVVTLQYYYRWKLQLNSKRLKDFLQHITSRPCCPPQHKPKFAIFVLSNVLNWGFVVYAVAIQPADFGTFFLTILLTNFILLLFYYFISKVAYRERPSFRPYCFFALSLVSWGSGVYFYLQGATDWLESPAVSRDGNAECVALFYDAHDFWHFTSAFALFFSFLVVMTLDDDTEGTPRPQLRVF